jgi:hypothetical protein
VAVAAARAHDSPLRRAAADAAGRRARRSALRRRCAFARALVAR